MTGSDDSASVYPLPLTAEGVTAAWLSAGLRTRNPGVVVDQVEPVQGIDGTATEVRLRPTARTPGDTPRGTHRARPARHVRARRSRGG